MWPGKISMDEILGNGFLKFGTRKSLSPWLSADGRSGIFLHASVSYGIHPLIREFEESGINLTHGEKIWAFQFAIQYPNLE